MIIRLRTHSIALSLLLPVRITVLQTKHDTNEFYETLKAKRRVLEDTNISPKRITVLDSTDSVLKLRLLPPKSVVFVADYDNLSPEAKVKLNRLMRRRKTVWVVEAQRPEFPVKRSSIVSLKQTEFGGYRVYEFKKVYPF